jgi:hypothetical protein
MSDEKMIDKIRKLLSKSRDAGASETEAAACAEKARELMEQHGLSEDAVAERVKVPVRLRFEARYMDPWRKNLGTAVGLSHGCVLVWYPRAKEFCFVGSETAAEVSREMYKHFERVVTTLASAHRSATGGARKNQLQFERGCALRVSHRLVEITRRREAPSSGEGALVLASEFDRVESWVKEATKVRDGDVGEVKVEGRSGLAGYRKGDEVVLGEAIGRD